MGVNMDGERDVLGCWVGPTGAAGAKFWMSALSELTNRGVQDPFIVCCDGLEGLGHVRARPLFPGADERGTTTMASPTAGATSPRA